MMKSKHDDSLVQSKNLFSPQSSKLVLSTTAAGDLGHYRCKAEFPSDGNFAGGVLYSGEAALIVLYINMETAASASKGDSLTLTATLINDKEVCEQFKSLSCQQNRDNHCQSFFDLPLCRSLIHFIVYNETVSSG